MPSKSCQRDMLCYIRFLLVVFLFHQPYVVDGQTDHKDQNHILMLSPDERVAWLAHKNYYIDEDYDYSVTFLDSLAALPQARKDERLISYIHLFRLNRYLKSHRQTHIPTIDSAFQSEKKWIANCPYPDVRALYKHYYGVYYIQADGKYSAAFRLLLEANKEFEKIGYENLPYGGDCLNDLGLYYYRAGYYDIALRYWRRAINCPFARVRRKISVLHSLGLGYKSDNIRDYKSAAKYFSMAKNLASKAGESVYVFVSTGDYGRVLQLQGRNKEALVYLNKCLRYVNPRENLNTSLFYLYKAEILLSLEKISEAKSCINKSDSLIKNADITHKRKRLPQHYAVRSLLYRKTGEYDKVLAYNDSILVLNDSISRDASNRILEEFEGAVTTEKYFSAISKIENDRKREFTLGILSFLGFLLIGCISFYGFKQRRQQLVKEKELNRKLLLQAEEKTNRIMHMQEQYLQAIQSKNLLIKKINFELAELRGRSERWVANKEEIHEQMNTLLNSIITTDEDWNRFKAHFEKIHPGFLEKLSKKYNFLTPSETRLAALSKLNIPNREMAVMLGVTKETIHKSMYRLRKKLESHDAHFSDLIDPF